MNSTSSRYFCILLLTLSSIFSGCSREYIITSKYRIDIIDATFPIYVHDNPSSDPLTAVRKICSEYNIFGDFSVQNSDNRKGKVLEENEDEAIDLFEDKRDILDHIRWEVRLREEGFTALRGSFLFVLQSVENEELVVFRKKRYDIQF